VEELRHVKQMEKGEEKFRGERGEEVKKPDASAEVNKRS